MNRRQKRPHLKVRSPSYRQAFERLDETLAENTPSDNSEQLAAIGKHIFGDLWKAPEPSGSEVQPK